MKRTSLVLLGALVTVLAGTTSCARQHYANSSAPDPREAPYAPTRSQVTPANTGDNTAGHQNRVNRAEADR